MNTRVKGLQYVWVFSFYFTIFLLFISLFLVKIREINDYFGNFGKTKKILTFWPFLLALFSSCSALILND